MNKSKSEITVLPYKMRYAHVKNIENMHLKSNFYGEIYEYYAYSKLLDVIDPSIRIVDKTEVSVQCGNFNINEYSSIHYIFEEIDIAEFDVLGIDDDYVYQFEITMNLNNFSNKIKRIRIREELLAKLFPNKTVKTIIVSGEEKENFNKYEYIRIDLPDFNELSKSNTFEFPKTTRKMISINEFAKELVNFNYIDEILKLSESYDNKEKLQSQNLIERVYDLKNIEKNSFNAYHIEKDKYEQIKIVKKRILKDGIIVSTRKKTYHEIFKLRQIMRGKYEN